MLPLDNAISVRRFLHAAVAIGEMRRAPRSCASYNRAVYNHSFQIGSFQIAPVRLGVRQQLHRIARAAPLRALRHPVAPA
ncbi:MAG: hypothetical protein JSS21_04630 [Proteobacteria bacterium]|nr:hypothetical protein [Pseudomonadota bacterium]